MTFQRKSKDRDAANINQRCRRVTKTAMTVTIDDDTISFYKDLVAAGDFPSLSATASAAGDALRSAYNYRKEHGLGHIPLPVVVQMMQDLIKAKLTDTKLPKPVKVDHIDIYAPKEFWDVYLEPLDRDGHRELDTPYTDNRRVLNRFLRPGCAGGNAEPKTSLRLDEDWTEYVQSLSRKHRTELSDRMHLLLDCISHHYGVLISYD